MHTARPWMARRWPHILFWALWGFALLGDLLGKVRLLGFLGMDHLRALALVAGGAMFITWARSRRMLQSPSETRAELVRQTRQRMQDVRGSLVDEREADEQVQRWEMVVGFLARAERGMPRDPEDLSDLRHADIISGLNDIKEAQAPKHLGTELSTVLSPFRPDGSQGMSRRSLGAGRAFIVNVRRTLRPWDVHPKLKLSRFDQPFRP